MYEHNGDSYFVVDGHTHWWDASPENTKNEWGEGWIECFYAYHSNLSPEEEVWSLEKYRKYSKEDMMKDLFEEGYVDKAILQPTVLYEFYHEGFNTVERDAVMAEEHPDQFILNTAWDPRNGDAGIEKLEADVERWGCTGVKLYTAEWKGDSKGWKLTDPESYRYLQKCEELGIKNIHVHKGPTIWPLNRDAFDVSDVDEVATAFQNLNFIIEHVGLPRLEDFCWIATQETNVYGGLAVALPFIHTRPRYFAKIIGELLYWLGEDKLLFGSDYALWTPRWLIEAFVGFSIPDDMTEYPELTTEAKKKILGLNAARLYGIDVPAELQLPEAALA